MTVSFVKKIIETPIQVFSCEYSEAFKSSFFYRTLLAAASGDVSETVKPDRLILSMKINSLNPTAVIGAILSLDKRKEIKNWIDLTLQYSNGKIMICFWQ